MVEKALKAWLYQLGDVPPFTHDLVLLFKRLLRAGADVELAARHKSETRCNRMGLR